MNLKYLAAENNSHQYLTRMIHFAVKVGIHILFVEFISSYCIIATDILQDKCIYECESSIHKLHQKQSITGSSVYLNFQLSGCFHFMCFFYHKTTKNRNFNVITPCGNIHVVQIVFQFSLDESVFAESLFQP